LKPDRGEASQALSEARRLKRRPLASRSIPRLNPKIKPKIKNQTQNQNQNQNQNPTIKINNQNQNQKPVRILLDSLPQINPQRSHHNSCLFRSSRLILRLENAGPYE
jgi:hypothetical protein